MRSGQVKLEKQAKGGSAWELGRREKQEGLGLGLRLRLEITGLAHCVTRPLVMLQDGPLCNRMARCVNGVQ